MLEKIFKKISPRKESEKLENYSRQKRKYITWTRKERDTLDKHIKYAERKRRKVNITRIWVIMPYRTDSSIRCKVRERCAILGVPYGTYTEKKETKNGKNNKLL